MAALNLNANLPVYIQWPDDAALTLIQRRRAYQPLFTTTRLHDQKQLWRGIAHEFWRVEPLVRSSQRNRVDRRTYEYRERRRSRRSRFQSPYHHRERGRSHSRSHRHRHEETIYNLGETTTSGERRSPVRSPDNDDDNMDFQYNHEDNDLSFQDINDDDNEYGSIGPQYYNDEMEDDNQSFDNEEEEETDNEYNSEEEKENDNEYNRDEKTDDNNGDNNEEEEEEGNNEDEEERNNDEEERNDNEEEEIHQIVEALDEDKIPSCNAYEDLVDIIHNPQFEPTHVLSYQLSISDIIWRVLNNPMLMKHMYFGPSVNSETKSEYWHGTLWGESPLFGQHEIIISEVIYQSGDFVYYHDNGLKKLGRAIKTTSFSNWGKKVTIMMTYKHQIIPEDYISVRNPPSSMPVYKLFLDLYYDDFGIFRNVYYSLGGVYIQFGNMPTHQRKLIKNHFVLEFIPFGRNFNEFMVPFVSEIKKFEKGKIMTVQGQDAWVIAGLGLVTADLPQGNDMAGESLKSVISKRGQLYTEYGLRSSPTLILDKLKRERHLQMPQDIYHATAGKIGRLLKLTCELFSQEGEDDFAKIWKNFEIPKKLAMIMPFLLNRFLKESSLKNNEAATIRQRIDVVRISLVLKAIISCWVHVAKTMKAVFNKEFTLDSYEELQLCLKEEFLILPKVFASFVNLPNIHINMHLLMHAKTFGTLVNSQVGIKEMVHRIFKGMVPKTNCKNIDLDLLKRYNTLFAIRHLADGEDKYLIEEQIQNDDVKVTSPVNFISNISLKKRMSKQEHDKLLLTLHNFKIELFLSYVDMKFEAALINSSISWYKLASYTIEEKNGILSKVHLHLGDFITIYEEDYESYAIIKGIFQYKGNNDKYYAFVVVDWFEDTMVEHSVLKCPLYHLQTTGDKWRRIFPITVIDNIQKVHFIHNCNSERCQLPNHDTTNRIWIKNNFYFTAI
ncbi:hypothetical protein GLOIN_2v1790940 [Rhizophagus irregularis DAOM 181602=DAOM 197198]|nr:hypothetical protein GLOIN_2v1790940 [Rhizophagus irregularis DAOM 181602=DAOM 197198]